MTVIKICGITNLNDAFFCGEWGVDMLGFNFYPKSKRYIKPDDATKICDKLRAQLGNQCPKLVGVFVNDVVGTISAITRQVGLDYAQLSGDESVNMLQELRGIAFKGIRPATVEQAEDDIRYYQTAMPKDTSIPSLLIDAHVQGEYGGTGQAISDAIAVVVRSKIPRMMLAGGLTPENVQARIASVRPWGVDVASGVEGDNPLQKDHDKIKRFIHAVSMG